MNTSWINNTRIRTIIITIIATLHLSACSTADFANAVADSLVSDTGVADTANTSGATFDPASGTTPVTNTTTETGTGTTSTEEPVLTPASGTPTSGSAPTSDPAPEPSIPNPVAIPTTTTAMYSYNANLSNAQLLDGAALEQTTVYMFFANAEQYSSMKFYCCKGVSGASAGESHKALTYTDSAPFVFSVDLSEYNTTGTRELYVDAYNSDSNDVDHFYIDFSIIITDTAPTETLSTSNVKLSWVAPVEREDNNPISPAEIDGYTIHYGTEEGSYSETVYIPEDGSYEHTITNLTEGTYYFVITTHDTGGRESKQSSSVTKTI